jgi:hypothetical protein
MGEEKKCPCDMVLAHEKRLYQGDTNFEVMEVKLGNIEKGITEIKGDLKTIKDKPGKKWENATTKISDWAMILILAYVAMNIGLQ